jgi:hypothetical protein
MSALAQVQGKVEYRLGDGPLLRVPPGEVEIDVGRSDVTLSWGSGPTRQAAAIPSSDFARYVDARAIVIWRR